MKKNANKSGKKLPPPPHHKISISALCMQGGFESFTISTINFSIHGSNQRLLTNYMRALGLNQVYMLLNLRNNYYKALICSFGSITNVYTFFLYLDNTDDF